MFAIAVALLALAVLVTASRRFLTTGRSRFAAAFWQLLLTVAGLGVIVAEHDHLGSPLRGLVALCTAVVACVLLDAVGLTRMMAKSLGG